MGVGFSNVVDWNDTLINNVYPNIYIELYMCLLCNLKIGHLMKFFFHISSISSPTTSTYIFIHYFLCLYLLASHPSPPSTISTFLFFFSFSFFLFPLPTHWNLWNRRREGERWGRERGEEEEKKKDEVKKEEEKEEREGKWVGWLGEKNKEGGPWRERGGESRNVVILKYLLCVSHEMHKVCFRQINYIDIIN